MYKFCSAETFSGKIRKLQVLKVFSKNIFFKTPLQVFQLNLRWVMTLKSTCYTDCSSTFLLKETGVKRVSSNGANDIQ